MFMIVGYLFFTLTGRIDWFRFFIKLFDFFHRLSVVGAIVDRAANSSEIIAFFEFFFLYNLYILKEIHQNILQNYEI